ncbi:MAG: isopentenyl-diphosphate Delta-isomerase [Parachlamydiales bacterium]|nr:isopentenyl-diphosphate Delta-isomerase [Parachlamydiales bacterium]
MEEVILVDREDNQIGTGEKMAVHLEGKLHRAFSVFIFNREGKMLLQQRAFSKYHSGGLWTNTCCSHPRPGEKVETAAHRRLMEEMGIACSLEKVFDFIYEAKLDHGLTEHEFDHVFFGYFDGDPILNPEEASAFRWIDREALAAEIESHPEQFTVWFKKVVSLAVPPHQRPLQPCS